VRVYNAQGQLVRTISDGLCEPGLHEITWDGKSEDGRAVAPGVYSCRMEAADYLATSKLVLTR
jgi:flagellar hook assembly protein FlgD